MKINWIKQSKSMKIKYHGKFRSSFWWYDTRPTTIGIESLTELQKQLVEIITKKTKDKKKS